MKRLLTLILAVAVLLSTGCNQSNTENETVQRQDAAAAAKWLLPEALDELFLYRGEIEVDKQAEPYYAPDGRRYRPVVGYATLEALRDHSRQIFTEDFCTQVIDGWVNDPQKPRFIEHEGRLWYTTGSGGMGWILSLVPATIEVVKLEGNSCIVSAYSESSLGWIERDDFLLLREENGWRLDSYYDFNRTLPVEQTEPTLNDYLSGGSGIYETMAIATWGQRYPMQLESHDIEPFVKVLAALEYLPSETLTTREPPQQETGYSKMETKVDGENYSLKIYNDGTVYIARPSGETDCLKLKYPAGTEMLTGLMNAAKWGSKFFY